MEILFWQRIKIGNFSTEKSWSCHACILSLVLSAQVRFWRPSAWKCFTILTCTFLRPFCTQVFHTYLFETPLHIYFARIFLRPRYACISHLPFWDPSPHLFCTYLSEAPLRMYFTLTFLRPLCTCILHVPSLDPAAHRCCDTTPCCCRTGRRRKYCTRPGHTRAPPWSTDTVSCCTAPYTDSQGTGSDLQYMTTPWVHVYRVSSTLLPKSNPV